MLVSIHKDQRAHSATQSPLLRWLFHSNRLAGGACAAPVWAQMLPDGNKQPFSVSPAGPALSPVCSFGAILHLVSTAQFVFPFAVGCLLGSLTVVLAVLVS